jgi:hypothetical protein
MSARPRYRVWAIPGASDEEGHCHFDVAGPDMNDFALQYAAAQTMQRALNAPQLTALERRAIVGALAIYLAGETDTSFSPMLVKAMRTALEKLR